MAELTYIETKKIYPHKDNPRKDLGDLTELTASIRASGVLQNLTVIPGHTMTHGEWLKTKKRALTEEDEALAQALEDAANSQWSPDGYTVIIGHRRLAAAKEAGLTEVPCVVTQMSRKKQLQTMLTENMQRSDLTVYEQAEGFQMMLDLGSTVEEIAADSGFSASTIRRRVKLLALDKERFKASEARGATLQDYMELDKIKDTTLKNQVLDTIGTANFQNELRKAQETEKNKAFTQARLAEVTPWADNGKDVPGLNYVKSYCTWNWKADSKVQRPKDAGTVRYYYKEERDGISIYREKPDETEEQSDQEREQEEAQKKEDQRGKQLGEINQRHRELRTAFIRDFQVKESDMAAICAFTCNAMIGGSWGWDVDGELLADLLHLEIDDETTDEDLKEMLQDDQSRRFPWGYKLLAVAYAATEDENQCYYDRHWNNTKQIWVWQHKKDKTLTSLYNDLEELLGYELSDEEKAMQDGSHAVFTGEPA
ncbi:MAG: ParB/RepB/Spo0J family partition protein [Clostridiales bacterium]|nr:ParB/RepB/Spo0J family partition protein [Clostridiales bacterium]